MKRLYPLLLLAAMALAAWAGWRLSQPVRAPQQGLATLPSIKVGDIARVTITPSSGDPIVLEKKARKWRLAGKKPVAADAGDVRQLLGDLAHMRVIRVVTHNRHHDRELGLDKGVRVRLQDAKGKTLMDLTVGNQGSDMLSTYVRRQGHPEVLAVDRMLAWQLGRSREAWEAPPPPAKKKSGRKKKGKSPVAASSSGNTSSK